MEILEIIIHASQEAFLHVGVTLALVILAFGYLDYKTKGRLVNLLRINPKLQPIIGSILGIIPGCGGTILLIPLYTKKKVSFGTLIASLIASMGDAAFILMAIDMQKYILVSIISFITAIITGYIVDGLKLDKVLKLRENDEVDHILHHSNKKKVSDSVYKFTHSMGYKLFYLLIVVGLVFTLVTNDGGLVHSHDHHDSISFEMIISIIGVGLSAIYMIISKKSIDNSTHEIVESKYLSFKEMVIHSACESAFVITWIFIGYVVYEIGILLIGGQEVVNGLLLASGVISIFIGALLGIIPGCGIQIIFISLYANGAIPFAALISNSISQDGDALFPLIALDKKSAFWATILTTIPAILIGLIVYW